MPYSTPGPLQSSGYQLTMEVGSDGDPGYFYGELTFQGDGGPTASAADEYFQAILDTLSSVPGAEVSAQKLYATSSSVTATAPEE
jgi:hypothetical protein